MPTPTPRTTKNTLIKALESVACPIYLLDATNTFVYVNSAFLKWTEVRLESVIGAACKYRSIELASNAPLVQTLKEGAFNGLAPPPDCIASEPLLPFFAHVSIHVAGVLQQRRCQFVPLALGGDEDSAVDAEENGFVLAFVSNVVAENADDPLSDPATSQTLHDRLMQLMHQLGQTLQTDSLIGKSAYCDRLRKQTAAAGANDLELTIVGPEGSGRTHLAQTIFQQRFQSADSETSNAGDRSGSAVPEYLSLPVTVQGAIADSQLLRSCAEQALEIARERRGRAGWGKNSSAWLLVVDADQLSTDAQTELWGLMQSKKSSLRVVATSQIDLIDAASEGDFHHGLAWRLSTLVINTIPLAERIADVPLLAQYFLEKLNRDRTPALSRFDSSAMQMLTEYHWPGNIAELRSVVEHAADRCSGAVVGSHDLPERFHHAIKALRVGRHEVVSIDIDQYLEKIERELVSRALRQAKGNKTQTAKLLGMNRARLLRRLQALGLNAEADAAKTASKREQISPAIPFEPLDEFEDVNTSKEADDDQGSAHPDERDSVTGSTGDLGSVDESPEFESPEFESPEFEEAD